MHTHTDSLTSVYTIIKMSSYAIRDDRLMPSDKVSCGIFPTEAIINRSRPEACFWEKLVDLVDRILRKECLFVLTDANARTGKRKGGREGGREQTAPLGEGIPSLKLCPNAESSTETVL